MPGEKNIKERLTESYNQMKIQAKELFQSRVSCLTKVPDGISNVLETLRQLVDTSWF